MACRNARNMKFLVYYKFKLGSIRVWEVVHSDWRLTQILVYERKWVLFDSQSWKSCSPAFRDSVYQRKISIFVVVVVLSSFIGYILSMLQRTLQANGLGFLGFRLASLASVLLLRPGSHTDRRKWHSASKDLNRAICGGITWFASYVNSQLCGSSRDVCCGLDY